MFAFITGPESLIIILLAIAIGIIELIPFWRLFVRVGFSGWLVLLMLVPIVNIVVLYIVAFGSWPKNKTTA